MLRRCGGSGAGREGIKCSTTILLLYHYYITIQLQEAGRPGVERGDAGRLGTMLLYNYTISTILPYYYYYAIVW